MAEYFTAMVELEHVLQVEIEIANHIKEYIGKERDRLAKLEALITNMAPHSESGSQDLQRHLENPINAYHLVKRFSVDWDEDVIDLIYNENSNDLQLLMDGYLNDLPDHEDLEGSARALFRLQDTYNLVPANMTRGQINGVKDTIKLTAHECFEIGRTAIEDGDFYHSVQWMEESLSLLREEDPKSMDEADILAQLSLSLFEQGSIYHAKNITKLWLSLQPDNSFAQERLTEYEEAISELQMQRNDNVGSMNDSKVLKNDNDNDKSVKNDTKIYEALCRGEKPVQLLDSHRLTCQYQYWHPMFYLIPLREETLNFDPWIVVYHQFITDEDIANIKSVATPRLQRSNVIGQADGKRKTHRQRISKHTWLEHEASPVVTKINRRITALTNLSVDTAESLQVANYGIGGHFVPHFDFASNDSIIDPYDGNRILTAILYMSDVQAGGSTVFVQAGVEVKPEKGACGVWYNLKASGEKDFSTGHAGCPVLVGSKWIATKWYHERDQEFNRPCDLTP